MGPKNGVSEQKMVNHNLPSLVMPLSVSAQISGIREGTNHIFPFEDFYVFWEILSYGGMDCQTWVFSNPKEKRLGFHAMDCCQMFRLCSYKWLLRPWLKLGTRELISMLVLISSIG